MPSFSKSGHDEVKCQVCGRLVDTGIEKVEWRPDLTGNKRAGNVCRNCLNKAPRLGISLREEPEQEIIEQEIVDMGKVPGMKLYKIVTKTETFDDFMALSKKEVKELFSNTEYKIVSITLKHKTDEDV